MFSDLVWGVSFFGMLFGMLSNLLACHGRYEEFIQVHK